MRVRRPSAGVSGSALVVVLLSLSVLVTGALAWETMASARRARGTAEGVLRDYARVTAVQFVREAEARLDTRIGSGIDGARHALQRHTGSGAGDGCQCPAPPSSTLFLVSRTDLTVSAGTLDPS